MNLIEKLIITFTCFLVLLGTIMLVQTSDIILQSQSAYALSDNKVWYILIHIGMITTFFFLNAIRNRWVYFVVSMSSIITLGLDMYGFKWHHNIATVILFISASYCLIYYSKSFLKIPYYFICGILGIGFILALTTEWWSVLEIETVIEWVFITMLLTDIYLDDKIHS